jgi:hypothetical protein
MYKDNKNSNEKQRMEQMAWVGAISRPSKTLAMPPSGFTFYSLPESSSTDNVM